MAAGSPARGFLVRGLLVGVAAGLAAFVVAYVLGEPGVRDAIGVEEAAAQAAGGHAHEEALVSRSVQSTLGLGTAMLGFGASFGGLFGLAFAVAYGRLGSLGARATAAVLAVVGFVAISLVPFVKYPANPPAVGDPETIGRRTSLYFLMLVLSLLFVAAATYLARRLPLGTWDRVLAGGGAYLVLVVAGMAVMPQVNEVGSAFPPTVLWSFRAGSLATLLTVWLVLGVLYGLLTERAEARGRAPAAYRTVATHP
ncbi:MAG: CbtA family protein [Actinomycetes bacterium]